MAAHGRARLHVGVDGSDVAAADRRASVTGRPADPLSTAVRSHRKQAVNTSQLSRWEWIARNRALTTEARICIAQEYFCFIVIWVGKMSWLEITGLLQPRQCYKPLKVSFEKVNHNFQSA